MLAKYIDRATIQYVPEIAEVERQQPVFDDEGEPTGETYTAIVSVSNYHMLTDEELKADGFKILIESPVPVEEGYYFTPYYTETKTKITQHWDRFENPPSPPYELSNQEITKLFNLLFGV